MVSETGNDAAEVYSVEEFLSLATELQQQADAPRHAHMLAIAFTGGARMGKEQAIEHKGVSAAEDAPATSALQSSLS